MATTSGKRYQELDALRGIAALMVVFFHFTMGKSAYNSFFKLGVTGVDLFFIISGFVIFMSLQKVSCGRDFVINRVSRLYPTYWASVTFTFLILTFSALLTHTMIQHKDILNYLGNLTMFQFYLRIPNIDGPYWTMIIEMIFYISILLLYQLKALKYLNAIGITLCLLVVFFTHFYFDVPVVKIFIKGIPLLQYFPLFFAGIIFYKIYTHQAKLYANYAIIIFCLICQLSLFKFDSRFSTTQFINYEEYCGMVVFYFCLFTAFINNKLKFIVNKVTLFLGKISFALYLTHQCVSITFIIPFLTQTLHLNFWVATVLINLPIVIGIASFITYKIEIPYSKKMREKLRLRMNSHMAIA